MRSIGSYIGPLYTTNISVDQETTLKHCRRYHLHWVGFDQFFLFPYGKQQIFIRSNDIHIVSTCAENMNIG